MAPLTDDVPSPVPAPARPGFEFFPNPASPPSAPTAVAPPSAYVAPQQAPPVLQPPPQLAPTMPPPLAQEQVQMQPQLAQPQLAPTTPPPVAAPPTATPFAGPTGAGAFALERHQTRVRSGNGVLDWIAFVLAFLAPPVGLLAGIGASVADSRNKGYVAGIAKAAIGVGAVLSLVLGVAVVVVSKMDSDQAAHNAIVASSRAYCTKLKADPATLASSTFGWPAPGSTIPASLTAIKSYESSWKSLVAVAPRGILADTKKVEAAAAGIVSSVQANRTLDDADNIAQMQNVIAATGIRTWVSDYCS